MPQFSSSAIDAISERLELFHTKNGIEPYAALDSILRVNNVNAADAARIRQQVDEAIAQLKAIANDAGYDPKTRADVRTLLAKLRVSPKELIFGLDKQIVIYAGAGLGAVLVLMLATKRRRG